MKRSNLMVIPAIIFLVAISGDGFAGSATLSKPRIESLLSAAGFQIRTLPDALHQAWYARTTPYTLERHIDNGEVVYTYTDGWGGFMYTGGNIEYQHYKRLLRERSVAQLELVASEAGDKPWQDWSWTWKPWELWWWSYRPYETNK